MSENEREGQTGSGEERDRMPQYREQTKHREQTRYLLTCLGYLDWSHGESYCERRVINESMPWS